MPKLIRDATGPDFPPGTVVEPVNVPGPIGPVGPPGLPGRMEVIVAQNVPAFYVVGLDGHGEGYLVSCLVEEDSELVLGVATYAALTGETVLVVTDGTIVSPGNWSTLGPVYLGESGELVLAIPVTGYVLKVGTIASTGVLIVRPEPALFTV